MNFVIQILILILICLWTGIGYGSYLLDRSIPFRTREYNLLGIICRRICQGPIVLLGLIPITIVDLIIKYYNKHKHKFLKYFLKDEYKKNN